MLRTAVIIIVVLAIIAGGIFALRRNTRTGMPGEDVLERARQRARQMEERDKENGRG
ncbi:MAG TPA: DUF2897 family protein [Steroidobacteraceae bacterium]|nr:DUF2897 family protein [Steroidobacteraceae bacterium]